MLIRRADQIDGQPVDMEGVQGVQMRLMVGRADGAPSFSMRHFTVEPGGHTPRHSHDYEHEVFVVEGRGQVEHDGEMRDIAEGDALFIEPNALHQFTNTSDRPLKFLCLVPTEFDCGTPTPGS
ncbi:MAG: cupin domain-containing protein [Planctomycetota bacterium]|jgi:quercetin dioxygenase-like cupin family protein